MFRLLTLFPDRPLRPSPLLLNLFLLPRRFSFSPFYPPSCRCSLSLPTPPTPPRLAPDFHTPATALPAQVEGGNTRPPACFRSASAPACTTRRIYALQFHWKIVLALEDTTSLAYTRASSHSLLFSYTSSSPRQASSHPDTRDAHILYNRSAEEFNYSYSRI